MPDKPLLTRMQREVLADRATGKTNSQIADERFLSKRTIDFHLACAYRILNVHNAIAAINEARRLGLID